MSALKTAPLSAHQAQNVINKIFHLLQEIYSQAKQPQAAELENLFSRNFELNSNGHMMCHNLNEFMKRIEIIKNKYSKVKFSTPHEEPLTSENRIVTNYTLHLTPRAGGQPIDVEIMAIATLEGEKLSKWHQVAHEKGTGRWDKPER